MHRSPLQTFFHYNGLSIVLILMFLLSWAGQTVTGWYKHNDDRHVHGQSELDLGAYLRSGHFLEATAENWESEFLQMAVFVYLSASLHQTGSPESNDPDEPDPPGAPVRPDSPWPVHKGGWVLRVYENSLTLAFLLLFLISFVLHAIGGSREYNEDQLLHGQPPVSFARFMITSEFWFQSLQNWQSEFLSIAAMVILAIFLRQKGSPESKDVATPNWEND